ncbi:type II secretion system protein [Grimontia sp. S25]|uniref:Type II secretion system protein n=1 Tax=Grimontia sedimenti TaxID=2711294 RepID=A0A6M1RQF1_9GAMM|nr:type II secretion system protein [Grimontia sedimenti]NGN98247.1 type II secretion system protein [Grimontia sedimenti]
MKRQGGFTLIEMIVVIVILGILGATAAPKFFNFKDDAETAALEGLKGAIDGAANMTFAEFQLSGEVTGVDTTTEGYPAATGAGIGAAVTGLGLDDDSSDWAVKYANDIAQFALKGKTIGAGTDCVVYKFDANKFPVTSIESCS